MTATLPNPAEHSRNRVLVAIGGNALYHKNSGASLDTKQVDAICERLVTVVKAGFFPVITFGNGPQVGNLYDMAETSPRMAHLRVPLDTCVSWTQGELGYGLALALTNHLQAAGLPQSVVGLNT